MKYTKSILKKIEDLFGEIGYVTRYERGNFQSGYCMVESKKIAVINRFYDVEARCNTLVEILGVVEIDESLLSNETLAFYKKIAKTISTPQKETESEEVQ